MKSTTKKIERVGTYPCLKAWYPGGRDEPSTVMLMQDAAMGCCVWGGGQEYPVGWIGRVPEFLSNSGEWRPYDGEVVLRND